MDLKTAQLIIVDAAHWRVPSIKFNYRGESTLNPNFKQITQFAKEHSNNSTFIDRIINSNFKFPNKTEIFEGLANQTKIKVSIDSFNKEIMEKQRTGAVFEHTVSNITKFYNQFLTKDSELVIQVVRTNQNKDEDFLSEIKKRWPSATLSIRDMVPGRIKDENTKDLEHKKRSDNRQSCIQAHARIIFDHQGTAQACCPDIGSKLNLGNIHDQNINQIWNGERAKNLRQSLKNKSAFDYEPCKSCPSFESYCGFKPSWRS
jgi:radical SAM protein with 4Fe4S-binding SPASM domain